MASPNGGPLGDFEAHGDIGSPKIAGYATYNAASQVYTLSAGGANIWAKRDEFQFAYRRMKGDFIVQAQVEFVGHGRRPASQGRHHGAHLDRRFRFGLCRRRVARRRAHLAAVSARRRAKTPRRPRCRPPKARTSSSSNAAATSSSSRPRSSASPSRSPKSRTCRTSPKRRSSACSSPRTIADVKETAVFRNVRVIKPVKVGFQPYRDYIGSAGSKSLNVTNGHRIAIYTSRVPFEAPNWLPDGSALIYNASGGDPATRGRLWKFDLATRTPTLIDTGFAIRNNNDHVLSFDGTQLAISDQSQDNGQSTIFTMPTSGGVPKRITPLTPSLHARLDAGREVADLHGRPQAEGRERRRVRHLQDRRPTAAARKSISRTRPASTTARKSAPTARRSTSTPRARARCRSGAWISTARTRNA